MLGLGLRRCLYLETQSKKHRFVPLPARKSWLKCFEKIMYLKVLVDLVTGGGIAGEWLADDHRSHWYLLPALPEWAKP